MIIQYQKISPLYHKYNPNGKTYYSVVECEECGMLHIAEVGIALKEDNLKFGDCLTICREGGWFLVYGNSKGLCKSLKSAQRKLNKMLKERKENEV